MNSDGAIGLYDRAAVCLQPGVAIDNCRVAWGPDRP